ncbi:hypothetical protein MBM09_02605 [Flaviramulus sp. BrNp1-15]|uniref:hypothetical protein n=1 Tax=Flaviramulus sp. BrNp1-15 TaxID=2916754 RepID=UPI001EE858EF|nr:hypothetical protein [Flaviramulus sp. BrNp1-15]ULC59880.1 hypothetical protein MBM09_02605 [Flaviramulus sp. BrNp1-15]
MKTYNDLETIERELKILDLEREIAWEEMKSIKEEYKQDLKPLNWVQSGFKIASKFGVMLLAKKIIK